MIHVLISSFIVAVVSSVIVGQAISIRKSTLGPKVRSAMLMAEIKIKALLKSPNSFVGCTAGTTVNCRLREQIFSNLRVPLPGGSEARLREFQFDPTTAVFTGAIVYTGSNINVADQNFSFAVPPEVLATSMYVCPPEQPIFVGTNSQGTSICRALPAESQCPAGTFANRVNMDRLTVTCDFARINSSCSINQSIHSVRWNNGAFDFTCGPRMNPFAFAERMEQFTPTVSSVNAVEKNPIVTLIPDEVRPADFQEFTRCECNAAPPIVGSCDPGFTDTRAYVPEPPPTCWTLAGACVPPACPPQPDFVPLNCPADHVDSRVMNAVASPICWEQSGTCDPNCVGSWGSCVPNAGTCGLGTETFAVTQSPSGGGLSCPSPATQSCEIPCDCEGSWGSCVPDSGTCGPGTETFTITQVASGGGAACPSPNTRVCDAGVCPPSCPVTSPALPGSCAPTEIDNRQYQARPEPVCWELVGSCDPTPDPCGGETGTWVEGSWSEPLPGGGCDPVWTSCYSYHCGDVFRSVTCSGASGTIPDQCCPGPKPDEVAPKIYYAPVPTDPC